MESQQSPAVPIPAKPGAPASSAPAENVKVTQIQALRVENAGLAGRKVPVPVLCAECGEKTMRAPTARPFSDGKYKGGFLCSDCWTLYWDEHPELLAPNARPAIAAQARAIRIRRAGGPGSELLYEDGESKAYLTSRGTVVIAVPRAQFNGPDEYDPARLVALEKLLAAVRVKMPDYTPPETKA